MKKRKIKKPLWRSILLLFGIALITWNCDKDVVHNSDENLLNQSTYSTVTEKEVIDFLSYGNKKDLNQKNNDSYVDYDISKLTYEEITNTEALLTVIPCETDNKAQYSRILMLKIRKELETVVFNMYPSANNKETNLFSGEITIATLQGKILRGFRIQEGDIINFYESNNYSSKSSAKSYSSPSNPENAECRQWCGHEASNTYCLCNMQHLDEVVVNGTNSITYISIADLYGSDSSDNSGCEVDCDNTWNSGGGGSTGSNSNLDNFLNQNVWDSQDPYDKWNELTECEKDFFSSNPQHLFTARGNKAEAERAAKERFGNCITPNNTNPLYQTIGDAYRHAYFAALNTHNMGYTNAKTLGDAHECNPNTSYGEDKAMDLHNNAWGYHYGSIFSIIDENQFFTTFMNAHNNGQIKILVECQ